MNRKVVFVAGLVIPAVAGGSVISFHDANQGYHYYGGYNTLMYGQGAVVDPGNNVWNGFGKYQGPTNNVFFGSGNPSSNHGSVPAADPGNPYAWYSGNSTGGTSLFSPTTAGQGDFGNANSDGTHSPVTLSLSYDSDNGLGTGASDSFVTQGTASKILSEAAIVTGGTLGTFTLGDVPAGTYNLFLYGASFDGDRGAAFSVSSGAAVGGITSTDNPGVGLFGGPLQSFVLGGDYVEFVGVTPDVAGNISGTWGAVTNSVSGQSGEGTFNGLQLQAVSVPEPIMPGIVALAATALGRRRRGCSST